MRWSRHTFPLALLAATAGGVALVLLLMIFTALAMEVRLIWILRDGFPYLVGGAVAGCVAAGVLWVERRCFNDRISTLLAGMITYYLCVLVSWSVVLAIEGGHFFAQSGGGFNGWLRELTQSLPTILAIATWPTGVIAIPLCFLLRWWIGRILGPSPSPPARMSA